MGLAKILIIEGNPHLRSLLGWHLQQAGYWVQQATGIAQARIILRDRQPTLVVIDSDLPDGDGLEMCRWLYRRKQSLTLMLSARNTQSDIVAGLKAGADDYLVKPFGVQEFMARVDALCRRLRLSSVPLYLIYGDLRIDLVQRRVEFEEEIIELTPQEFSLLYILAQAEGDALTRSELLERAWPNAIDNPRTIDTHVLSLRKKLEAHPRRPNIIQTVRNVGYRFNPEVLRHRVRTPPLPVQATAEA
ncbi:response regulator transcription factor [Spirulina subsalsa]|uniref:response regulator transcription factor n=1 Tax=Spirulina subsalsa TaxID=54311 RepID=UPI0002D4D79C|nr:response regulator transcription factor [Spirulina subsalsa]